jgi:hypothetical protein
MRQKPEKFRQDDKNDRRPLKKAEILYAQKAFQAYNTGPLFCLYPGMGFVLSILCLGFSRTIPRHRPLSAGTRPLAAMSTLPHLTCHV